jgi:superfamily II DNA/RNA helicase
LRRCFVHTPIARQQYAAAQQQQQYEGEEDPVSETVLPGENDVDSTKFEELGQRKLVHPTLLRAIIGDMGLTNMTDVQTQTLNAALSGRDV